MAFFVTPLALRLAAFGYTLTLGACLERKAIDFTALVTTSHRLAQPLGWLWLTRKLTRKLNPSKTLAVSHAIATRTPASHPLLSSHRAPYRRHAR